MGNKYMSWQKYNKKKLDALNRVKPLIIKDLYSNIHWCLMKMCTITCPGVFFLVGQHIEVPYVGMSGVSGIAF